MNRILQGDALSMLDQIPDCTVQSCITSPPYYGLRDYQTQPVIWDATDGCAHEWGPVQRTAWANEGPNGRQKNSEAGHHRPKETGPFCQRCGAWCGELGLEPTAELYVQHLVAIFRKVRRVLRPDGTLWVNLGDSYAGGGRGAGGKHGYLEQTAGKRLPRSSGLKNKDLLMIPARVALALQKDGWYLRCDCVWNKPNSMPESCTDRPNRSHEYVFLLSRSEHYYYDAEAVKEPSVSDHSSGNGFKRAARRSFQNEDGSLRGNDQEWKVNPYRNRRSVWNINTEALPIAHFATMPRELAEVCILAGSSPKACEHCGAPWERLYEPTGHLNTREPAHVPGNTLTKVDSTGWAPTTRATETFQPSCQCPARAGRCVILDPFAGAGTTGLVALSHGRDFLGIELNPEYVKLADERLAVYQPHLWEVAS